MKCNANKLFLATTITVAITWVLCAIAVSLMPAEMLWLTGHMVHLNLDGFKWSLTIIGFFVGLAAWTLLAGVIVWLIAIVYNRLAA